MSNNTHQRPGICFAYRPFGVLVANSLARSEDVDLPIYELAML